MSTLGALSVVDRFIAELSTKHQAPTTECGSIYLLLYFPPRLFFLGHLHHPGNWIILSYAAARRFRFRLFLSVVNCIYLHGMCRSLLEWNMLAVVL